MKKMLTILATITSLYATPPCELPNENVCMYLYKGAMSSEIIIVNMSKEKVLIKRADAYLDGESKDIRKLILNSGQTYTMIKSRYDTHDKKPSYQLYNFDYETIK